MPQQRKGYVRLDVETAKYFMAEAIKTNQGTSELEKAQKQAVINLIQDKISKAEGK